MRKKCYDRGLELIRNPACAEFLVKIQVWITV